MVPCGLLLLIWPPEDTRCDGSTHLPAGVPVVTVAALKTVVEPFNGRHRVYGLFALPLTCPPGQPVILSVAGVGHYCDTAENTGRELDGVRAPPGHYLMRDPIRTRTALGLLLWGQGDRLRQPRNWTLSYAQPGN